MSWTPELRKQHRRVCPTQRITQRDPEVLAEEYAQWRHQQGLTSPVAVFPRGKSNQSLPNRVRDALSRAGCQDQVEVDPEEYKL